MLTKADIESRLEKMIQDVTGLDEGDLTPQCTWSRDLALDELDRESLTSLLEEEFSVSTDGLLDAYPTLGDLVAYLYNLS